MSAGPRLWITGAGAVTALGASLAETWGRVLGGEIGIRPVTLFDVSRTRASRAGQVDGLAVGVDESRADAMAVAAAREALAEARLDPRSALTGLAVGASTSGMWECEERMAAAFTDVALRVPDAALRRQAVSAPAEAIVRELGLDAHRVVCSACSAGSNAIVTAVGWLRSGRFDRVLAGGVDGLCRLTWSGFDGLQVMSPVPCRPFDLARSGMSLGEGAAFLVVETEASARARGAVPLAEIAGHAAGSEAHHITQPDPAAARVQGLLRSALRRGRIDPSEVDYVHAHGTGTLQSDRAETAAIRAVLGDRPWVSSHKGQLGHTLAAAGAVGAALTVRAIADGRIPPTGGLVDPDPDCAARHVVGASVDAPIRVALVHAFGFGGLDTVLALRHPGGPEPRPVTPTRVVVTGAVAVGAQGVRQGTDCLDLTPVPAGFDPVSGLDRDRVRRLDRATRMLVLAVSTLLDGVERSDGIGVVAGNTWGAVEETARYLRRMLDHGGRTPDPFLFPNLVPSSPAAHAALYAGARGPVLSTPDAVLPSEAAFHQAIELLEADDASALAVCGHSDDSEMLRAMYLPLVLDDPRSREGAAGLLLETEAHAALRGVPAIARVVHHGFGIGEPGSPPDPTDRARACVVATRGGRADGWSDLPCIFPTDAGDNEATGAHALVTAVALLASGRFDEALIEGRAGRSWSQVVLARP